MAADGFLTRDVPALGQRGLFRLGLAPSFGMVGTITGMIQLFQKMGADNMDLGSAISLALLATLYGVAFGPGVISCESRAIGTRPRGCSVQPSSAIAAAINRARTIASSLPEADQKPAP